MRINQRRVLGWIGRATAVAGGIVLALYAVWMMASALLRCGNIDCTEQLTATASAVWTTIGAVLLLAGIVAVRWGIKGRLRKSP